MFTCAMSVVLAYTQYRWVLGCCLVLIHSQFNFRNGTEIYDNATVEYSCWWAVSVTGPVLLLFSLLVHHLIFHTATSLIVSEPLLWMCVCYSVCRTCAHTQHIRTYTHYTLLWAVGTVSVYVGLLLVTRVIVEQGNVWHSDLSHTHM